MHTCTHALYDNLIKKKKKDSILKESKIRCNFINSVSSLASLQNIPNGNLKTYLDSSRINQVKGSYCIKNKFHYFVEVIIANTPGSISQKYYVCFGTPAY